MKSNSTLLSLIFRIYDYLKSENEFLYIVVKITLIYNL